MGRTCGELPGTPLEILFIGLPAHGHVNPSLGLVRELVRRGHHVSYLLPESYREEVRAVGGALVPYGMSFDLDRLRLSPGNLRSVRRIIGMFRRISALAEQEVPRHDFLVYDSLFFPGDALARRSKTLAACSVTTFAVNSAVVEEALASRGLEYALLRGRRIRAFIPRLLDVVAPGVAPARLPDLFDLFKSPSSGLKIVYTSRAIQPHGDQFDETFLFVGPSLPERVPDPAFPFQKLRGKIVYVSLGTVTNAGGRFFSCCFEAFADMDVTVVMSVGKRVDIRRLPALPGNFLVFHRVPQLEVLRRADVFVTHGGMNSVSEGLSYGVPLLVIPQGLDQPLVARRVCELGAALRLRKGAVTAASLRGAVRLLLDDGRYRERSREVGESLLGGAGLRTAAEEIERRARAGGRAVEEAG